MPLLDSLSPVELFFLDRLARSNNVPVEEALVLYWKLFVLSCSPTLQSIEATQLPAAQRPVADSPLPTFRKTVRPAISNLLASWFGDLRIGSEKVPFGIAPVKTSQGNDIAISWSTLAEKIRHKRGAGFKMHADDLYSFKSIEVTQNGGRGRNGRAFWCSDLEAILGKFGISAARYSWVTDWLEGFDAMNRFLEHPEFAERVGGLFHRCEFRLSRDPVRPWWNIVVAHLVLEIAPRSYEVPLWDGAARPESDRVEFEPFPEPTDALNGLPAIAAGSGDPEP